jgi:glycerophosphoryl diester phosphodiesterase
MRVFCSIAILLLSASAYAGSPMIVAHRGASQEAPQNTIPAFKLAWKQGADAIEGDFHLTKDGHIVCIHDRDTKKVSNTNLVVSDSTLSELRQVDVGAWKDPAFEGVLIPTLAEVLSTIPKGKTIYIEVKCGVEIIPPLLEALRKSGLKREQLRVISFKDEVIQALKASAPQYQAFWLCSFRKNKADVIKPPLQQVLNTMQRIQADGLSSNADVPHSVIEAVKQQGYEWHVWTINDLEEAQRMTALGASSITTDVPGHIQTGIVEGSAAPERP